MTTTGTRTLVAMGFGEILRPGTHEMSGTELSRFDQIVITVMMITTNLIGGLAVLVIAVFVVPLPPVAHTGHLKLVNAIAAAGYGLLACPIGTVLGTRGLRGMRKWLTDERAPTLAETRIVLRAPLRMFLLTAALWLFAAALFGVLNATHSGALGVRVASVIALTGLVTGSCAYLLTELLLRPTAARALGHGAPGKLEVPGVATRAVLAWTFGTGLPVFGTVVIGIFALSGAREATPHQLGVAMVALGGTGIAVGLLAVTLAARATADPVESVRKALAEVQAGDFGVRVPVYDGTQIGQLQLGFNTMAEGLAERERIREAFGTYVDPDVATHVLEEGTRLEGEQVEVTLMFLDVRGFTEFAESTPAEEVVAALNALFERIVPIIHDHGGRVDKFIGDGLLAVFGAPSRQEDHADQALAAALQIADQAGGRDRLSFGIGLNSGDVVAGNLGGAGRLEFSVIGDPVNVAARVESATRETGDTILITERTKELLQRPPTVLQRPPTELTEREGVTLKGKQEPVRVFAPEPPPERPSSPGTAR